MTQLVSHEFEIERDEFVPLMPPRPTSGTPLLSGLHLARRNLLTLIPHDPDAATLADRITDYFEPIILAPLRRWFWITDLDLDKPFPTISTRRTIPRTAVFSSA